MEQRTYSDQNDIRPIEELLSGGKKTPEPYHGGYHYPENMQSSDAMQMGGVQQSQHAYAAQGAISDYASATSGASNVRPESVHIDAPLSEQVMDTQHSFLSEPAVDEAPLPLTSEKQAHHSRRKKKFDQSRMKSPTLWAVLGFACGVAFWNMVGFWGFVEDAVLQSPEQTQLSSSILRSQNSIRRETPVRTRANRPMMIYNHVACTSLVMDRRRGVTSPARCEQGKAFYQGRSQLRTSARLDY